MNKTRKVELLYKIAKGQSSGASPQEIRELRKYRVGKGENAFCTTKANISGYVSAVDNAGCTLPFYDWCMENKKGDRRRKGSSEQEIESFNKMQNKSVALVGWLIWGIALYWIFGGALSVGVCAIGGAVISVLLFRRGREQAGLTLVLIPIVLAVFFGSR